MLERLRKEIGETVELYCSDPGLKDAVAEVLARPGYALHSDSRCRAGSLALLVYETLHGEIDGPGWKAAVAVELYMEAAFLFDDVADDDVAPDSTPAEEIAVALTVLNCGAGAASEAAAGRSSEGPAFTPLQQMAQDCITACAGQYGDAALSDHDLVSADEALRMTEMKAGACGRLVTSFAAGIGGQNRDVASHFGEFGFNLFTHM